MTCHSGELPEDRSNSHYVHLWVRWLFPAPAQARKTFTPYRLPPHYTGLYVHLHVNKKQRDSWFSLLHGGPGLSMV